MTRKLPRIKSVTAAAPNVLWLQWKEGAKSDSVDLTGWIAGGGDVLMPLQNEETFAKARIENYGSAIAWDDGNLAIDVHHLRQLVDEQKRTALTRRAHGNCG